VAETATIKYRAFLSYSHRDQAWARWLHSALEGYRIGKDLVGRPTPVGPVPRTLRPIFRDREDFSAGHSLTAQTLVALEASQFLIVICSPHAAQSRYVDEEIRRFRMLGRADRIIPVIVEGEPGECFPEALRVKVGPDGAPTGEREEPIAADARPQGDGKELAKHKVVAGLLGVGLDEIVRRGEQARRRHNHILAGLAGMFMALAIAASGSAVYAWHQLKTNEAFLNATLKRATEIVDEAVAQAEKYNVPRGATLALLARAEGLFDDMARYGRPTPELRYRKAAMLIQFARNYDILGDSKRQFARAAEAQRLLADLATEKSGDNSYQRELSVALNEVGIVLQAQGKLGEALASYRAGLVIAERLTASDPGNNGWLHDLLVSHDRVGEVLFNQGGLGEALTHYRASLAAGARLTAADPANPYWQRSLSMSHVKVGDVLAEQGELDEALASYRASFVIRERLAAAEPGNAGWQRDLSVARDKVGDVLGAQGKLEEAYDNYRAGLAIAERLAAADPSHAGWQRDLSVSHNKVGDVLADQGKREEALASYRASLAIRARLAAADPSNEGWQRDLSLSHEKVGDGLRALGKLDEALASYRFGLAIRARLAAADASNAGWQRDLSVAHNKIGEALREQGRFDEALASYRADLAIAERLAAADSSNAVWQRDLAISHAKVALAFRNLGKPADALVELREGRRIMAVLVERSPGYVQWTKNLAAFDWEIADVERQLETAQQ
jgi:tetratricopeptide (TPR) repeat protein